jgi:hypothetical protein
MRCSWTGPLERTSEMSQKQTSNGQRFMSALPLEADIRGNGWNVCYVP